MLAVWVVKLQCDMVGRGMFPPPGYQDHIALNRWTKVLKLEVPGRIATALMPPRTMSRQPKLGHNVRALMPRRFFAQLNTDDLHMLVAPPTFQRAPRDCIKITLPSIVALGACRLCDEWVQVTYHGGQLVLARNWPNVVCKYDLHYNKRPRVRAPGVHHDDEALHSRQLHRQALHLPSPRLGGVPGGFYVIRV